MKASTLWAAMGIVLASMSTGTAQAQDTTFTLVNNTEFSVYSVYIWPVSSRRQGQDYLGDDMIVSGRSQRFTPDDDECEYNIRVTMMGTSDEYRWNRVNLCRLSTLTLHYNYTERNLWASTR